MDIFWGKKIGCVLNKISNFKKQIIVSYKERARGILGLCLYNYPKNDPDPNSPLHWYFRALLRGPNPATTILLSSLNPLSRSHSSPKQNGDQALPPHLLPPRLTQTKIRVRVRVSKQSRISPTLGPA